MIIGFDGSRAFSETRTGTENYSFQLLKALSKIDQKNKYIVYLRPNSVIPSKEGIQKKGKDTGSRVKPGMTMEDWPDNFEFKVISWPRLWTQVGLAKQTFREKLDVLFIPAHTSPLIHKKGLKSVVTVHDLGAEYLPKMHQVKQRLYLKWITNYQLKNATKLIAVSEATKKDLEKKVGINSNKIKVVYEGLNVDLFKSMTSDTLVNTLREYDLKNKEYFLFVGTIQPRKNLERLIRAFQLYISRGPASSVARRASSLPAVAAASRQDLSEESPLETKLVLVGSKGWLSDEIFELPKKLGIEDNVRFLGRVPDEQLPALYKGAKAFLFPSLFEGFGLPILESEASGTPVLTSNLSSMPEVAGKGAILVDPYSIESISDGITKVAEAPEGLIKAGLENVKRFSWDKAAKETLQVLENVV